MSTITEFSSRIHSDHDIRNITLLEDFVNAATNYWVLCTDILQANAPHQPGPSTMFTDSQAHPLHQLPRTISLTATYYAREGTRQQRQPPNTTASA